MAEAEGAFFMLHMDFFKLKTIGMIHSSTILDGN